MIGNEEIAKIEVELCSFSPSVRSNAVAELAEIIGSGKYIPAPETDVHNLHCHTFFSYNGYGFSPSRIVWMAKKRGFFAVGMVDFDVLDAVDEFLAAAKMLDVRAVCGLESRVCLPELAEFEINSPGEPGIAYNMGCGFASGTVPEAAAAFADKLRTTAACRTQNMVKLVNEYLAPVKVEFKRNAVRLTPNGNVTERHLCRAYREKAERHFFGDVSALLTYWSEKLGVDRVTTVNLVADVVALEGAIRSKTMKQGGVGYVKPGPESFPELDEMNDFTLQCGGLPSLAWLNGLSAGERDVERLLDVHQKHNSAVLNIVPDRNWNVADPEKQRKLAAELDRVIEAALRRGMLVCAGTELNAPGMKFVDDFDNEFLAKHLKTFADGAAAVYAHSLMQKHNRGLLSSWAKKRFNSLSSRNEFYSRIGREIRPSNINKLESMIG